MGNLRQGATYTYEHIDNLVWATDVETGKKHIVGGDLDAYKRALAQLHKSTNNSTINNE
jgi:hypothetical protein